MLYRIRLCCFVKGSDLKEASLHFCARGRLVLIFLIEVDGRLLFHGYFTESLQMWKEVVWKRNILFGVFNEPCTPSGPNEPTSQLKRKISRLKCEDFCDFYLWKQKLYAGIQYDRKHLQKSVIPTFNSSISILYLSLLGEMIVMKTWSYWTGFFFLGTAISFLLTICLYIFHCYQMFFKIEYL